MNKKSTEKLIKNFPKIFSSDFYFQCDEGWFELIFDLCTKIQKYCDENKSQQVTALQVKEKYASLRFYTCGGDDYIYELIRQAEKKSAETCEVTGGYGVLHRVGFYYKTLCKETGVLMGFKVVKSKKLFKQ